MQSREQKKRSATPPPSPIAAPNSKPYELESIRKTCAHILNALTLTHTHYTPIQCDSMKNNCIRCKCFDWSLMRRSLIKSIDDLFWSIASARVYAQCVCQMRIPMTFVKLFLKPHQLVRCGRIRKNYSGTSCCQYIYLLVNSNCCKRNTTAIYIINYESRT